MSDTQRQVKMVAEQAMASLVERAKRLRLSSVSTIQGNEERIFRKSLLTMESSSTSAHKKSKGTVASGVSNCTGAQRVGPAIVRKPRKIEAEPTPPPPSPREQCMIAELREEYNQTDQLIEKMLSDATSLHEDMLSCSQHQRDFNLVQEIELETNTRSVDTLFEALSAECERPDLKDVMRRCCSALERSKERVCSPIKLDLQFIKANTAEDTTSKKTWSHVCYTNTEALDNGLPPPGYPANPESMLPNTINISHTPDMDIAELELITPQT